MVARPIGSNSSTTPDPDPVDLLARLTAELSQIQETGLILHSMLRQGSLMFRAQAAAALTWIERGQVQDQVGLALTPEVLQALADRCRELARAGSCSFSEGPIQIVDVEDPAAGAWGVLAGLGFRGLLILPLQRHPGLQALLLFLFLEPIAAGPRDLRWARMLGDLAGLALENSRLFEAALKQAVELGAFYETVTATAEGREIQPLLEGVVDQAYRLLDGNGGAIMLLEEGGRLLRAAAVRGFPDGATAPVVQVGEGITGEVAAQRAPVQIPDVAAWRAARPAGDEEQFPFDRALAVPLAWRQELLGVLVLGADRNRAPFSDSDLRLAQVVARQAANALGVASLYRRLAEENSRLLELYAVGQLASGSLVYEDILRGFLEGMLGILAGSFGVVYRLGSPNEEGARPLNTEHANDPGRALGEVSVPAERLARLVMEDQSPRQDWVPSGESGYWLTAAPLVSGGEAWGAVLIGSAAERGAEAPPLWALAAGCQQAGLALWNAEQHERVGQRLAEMTLLQGVAGASARRLERDAVLRTVTEQLHSILGYPAVEVYVRSGGEMVMTTASGPRPVVDHIPIERGIIGRVARTGQAACVPDVRQDPDYVAGLVGTRAEMAVPIRIADEIYGVLNIETSDPDQVGPENLELLQVLADQVSVALQNASLYEQVQRNVEQLNERVRERTARLEQALVQAQAAEKTKAQFITDVSHELRTPLTNIGLYLDLLEMGKDDRREEYMEILRHESERLGSLIEQLLTLSEHDAGQAELHREPTDINALIRMLVGDRARMIESRGLRLSVETAHNLPRIPVDPRQVMQVMANLLTNASNYTPAGGLVIIQSDRRVWHGGRWVTFSVADTGPGIPEHERPRVFDRFFRGISGRASGIPGTGLGLAICQEIVDRHGGRIALTSQTGKGTKVTVWLPEEPAVEA